MQELIKLVEGLGGGGKGENGDKGDKGEDAKLDLGPQLEKLLSKHSDAWSKIMKEEISKMEVGKKAPMFSFCSGTDAVSPVPMDSIKELLALVKLLTSAERQEKRFWWLDEIKPIVPPVIDDRQVFFPLMMGPLF